MKMAGRAVHRTDGGGVSRVHRPATPALAARHQLRYRLPLLMLALVGLLGSGFAWMAYREVQATLLARGTYRVTTAGGELAALLAQSTEARRAEVARLASHADLPQAFESGGGRLPVPILEFLERTPQAAVWLYDADRRLPGPVAERAANAGREPPPFAEGVGPLRLAQDRVSYLVTAPVPAPDRGGAAGFVAVEWTLGSATAFGTIERLIGLGAGIKLGNAADDLWTDLAQPVDPPPAGPSGTAVQFRAADGEGRLGIRTPIEATPWVVWTEASESALLEPARALLDRMLPIALLVALLGGLAVYTASARITAPLVEAAEAADALAAGDFTRRIAPGRQDEIGRLAAAFNLMAARLGESHEALEARVRERTAEVERVAASLERHATELASANHELEAFSYSVSHDLRAPLRSIDGFAQALVEDYTERLDDTGRDFLARIRAAAQRMGMLIDDLLALSRVTRVPLQVETVDLSAIAADVLARLREREPGRDVRAEIASGLAAPGDPRLLRVALENLLENAWKFTSARPDGWIAFGPARAPDGTRAFVVRDNGAGFDMAHTGKLFGAFQRLHGAREFPGTGVGLATVQRVVRRHGGTIWAEAAVGAGAAFYFTLGEGEA